MVKKDQKWEWTERQEEAFKKLKEKFTKEPVLAVPDLDKKMRMEVDASDYVLQLRNLSVGLGEEPCIGFIQENSMENSLQDLSLLIYFSPWSMLRLRYSYPKVHAFTSCPITHLP